jgi:hypothetical protein
MLPQVSHCQHSLYYYLLSLPPSSCGNTYDHASHMRFLYAPTAASVHLLFSLRVTDTRSRALLFMCVLSADNPHAVWDVFLCRTWDMIGAQYWQLGRQ